jgi:hypothetical protein
MSTGGVENIDGGSGANASTTTYTGITGNALGITGNILGAATTGPVYAIQASGTLSTTQTFTTIHRLAETVIGKYDVTGALEVLMDVRFFNQKLGIYKDASNVDISGNVTASYYDDVANMLLTDTISFSAQDFINQITTVGFNANNIVSVGILSTIYKDFSNYIATYFGMPGLPTAGAANTTEYGFATLFGNNPTFDPNSGVFDPSAMYLLLQEAAGAGWSDGSGNSVSTLSGSVTVSNITSLLRNACDANPFGNRDPVNGVTAGDPYDHSNYGVTDGFYANDLFFIPNNGINITLSLSLDQEAFPNPTNNVGTGFMAGTARQAGQNASANASAPSGTNTGSVADASFQSHDVSGVAQNVTGASTTSTTFSSSTQITSTLITRNVQAPLLIRLANLTTVGSGFW